MNISVLKFGGSNFINLNSYSTIASYIQDRVKTGEKIAVVVSAMSGTTGRLKESASKIWSGYSQEAGDLLLATGEIVSASLLRIACEKIGLSCCVLTGFQLGLETDDNFGRARVHNIDPSPLLRSVTKNSVTVICGGQGATKGKQLSMLGRNSSDLTAIFAAKILQTEKCEIFSDVPGVYSADPYWISSAQCLNQVSYNAASAMSKAGAKVLHYGCVESAKEFNIAINCCSFTNNHNVTKGTIISNYGDSSSVILAPNVYRLKPMQSSNFEKINCYLTTSNLNYLVFNSRTNFYLIDSSVCDNDLHYLRQYSKIDKGCLVSQINGKTILKHCFVKQMTEAQSVARQYHDSLQLGTDTFTNKVELIKSKSNMSNILIN